MEEDGFKPSVVKPEWYYWQVCESVLNPGDTFTPAPMDLISHSGPFSNVRLVPVKWHMERWRNRDYAVVTEVRIESRTKSVQPRSSPSEAVATAPRPSYARTWFLGMFRRGCRRRPGGAQ